MGTLIVNPYLNGQFFLDTFPGAAAAYSLRQLSSTTTNVVRVRRSSDNLEQDFTASEVENGALTTWVGTGNDGFVTIWYDQSGYGNNGLLTAGQPTIVDNGVLVTENEKAAIDLNGASGFSVLYYGAPPNIFQNISDPITLITIENPRTISQVSPGFWAVGHTIFEIRQNKGSGAKVPISFGYTNNFVDLGLTDNYFDNAEHISSSVVNLSRRFLYTKVKNNSVVIYDNGSEIANDSISVATGDRSISVWNPSSISIGFRTRDNPNFINYYDGLIQELILYPSDQSTNRAAIGNNINSHYGIY